MHPDAVRELEKNIVPTIGMVEAIALEEKYGFKYRTALGEAFYEFFICRPDVGTAVDTLV